MWSCAFIKCACTGIVRVDYRVWHCVICESEQSANSKHRLAARWHGVRLMWGWCDVDVKHRGVYVFKVVCGVRLCLCFTKHQLRMSGSMTRYVEASDTLMCYNIIVNVSVRRGWSGKACLHDNIAALHCADHFASKKQKLWFFLLLRMPRFTIKLGWYKKKLHMNLFLTK